MAKEFVVSLMFEAASLSWNLVVNDKYVGKYPRVVDAYIAILEFLIQMGVQTEDQLQRKLESS